jgi:hypothetical protein
MVFFSYSFIQLEGSLFSETSSSYYYLFVTIIIIIIIIIIEYNYFLLTCFLCTFRWENLIKHIDMCGQNKNLLHFRALGFKQLQL